MHCMTHSLMLQVMVEGFVHLFKLLCCVLELPYDDRITAITALVNKLPRLNYKVLNDFITHLSV